MPTLELHELLDCATGEQETVIRDIAYTAGVLWQCRNANCGLHDRPRNEQHCPACGHDRQGQPIGDRVPITHGPILPHLLTALREALVAWFTERHRPLPDAVSFQYTDQYESHEWSDWGALHFGGRTEPYCDFDGSDVAEVLTEISDDEAPQRNDVLTVALPR
ncbi:hypothetical protein ABR737_01085 [Streptomyces sp. Edi2]|uniref:hypothetical protein n=1 Tax=Streptomyces sp. Edi2 TaxID=3162528 RepID=UPI0033065C46